MMRDNMMREIYIYMPPSIMERQRDFFVVFFFGKEGQRFWAEH